MIHRICLMVTVSVLLLGFLCAPTYAGECLWDIYPQEEIALFKKEIAFALENDGKLNPDNGISNRKCLFLWIEYYGNEQQTDIMGELVLNALKNPKLTPSTKSTVLDYATGIAPGKIADDLVRLYGSDDSLDKPTMFSLLWSIIYYRGLSETAEHSLLENYYAYNDRGIEEDKLAQKNILLWLASVSKRYQYDYPRFKKAILAANISNIEKLIKSHGYLKKFDDPRARTVDLYDPYVPMPDHNPMFYFLASHLESEFTQEQVGTLSPYELKLMRNAIFHVNGRTERNFGLSCKLKSLEDIFCNHGLCGRMRETYDTANLSETDWKNIALIQKMEAKAEERENA